MPTVNESILDGNIRHAHWLERYKTGVVRQIIALLNRADTDLSAILAERLDGISGRGFNLSDTETKRLQKLLDELRVMRLETGKLLYEETRTALDEFALHETDFQAGLIEKAAAKAGTTIQMARPALSQLRAVVTARPFQGRILKEWHQGLAEASAAKLRDAIKIGIVEGQTNEQIVRRIRGSRALKYTDGILSMGRRNAEAVVRTAIAHVANVANNELYAANTDIVQGVQWVSTLDTRTTAVCRARDGEVYPIDKGPRPPAHWGCRSTTVPYLGPDVNNTGSRASVNGPVPRAMKYQDWLKSQSPDVQDEILGKAKAKLFRDGHLSLDRFVDQTGNEYTLDELRKLDRDAFDQTFGPSKAMTNEKAASFKEYIGAASYKRLRDGFNQAVKDSGAETHGMTEAEQVAIHAYTHGDKYYERLNTALRSDDAESIARVAPMAQVLDTALEKLPRYEGMVTRVTDMPEETWLKYKNSGVYVDFAYMSTSKHGRMSGFSGNYEFTIMSKNGREIDGYSAYPHEGEVVFPRETKFDIIKIDQVGNITQVVLKEQDG